MRGHSAGDCGSGVSLERGNLSGRKDTYTSHRPWACPRTVHTVLMVLIEVLVGVPAHGGLCGVVVNRDRRLIPWGVACGRASQVLGSRDTTFSSAPRFGSYL